MPTTIVTTASNPLTLYYNNPFTYTFTAQPVDADEATIQFTDSTSLLTSNISGSNFTSTTGYSQYGFIGNLIVDAVSSNRPKVETFAGSGSYGSADGIGSNAQFRIPEDLCIDGTGNIFVCDTGNHLIRKITPTAVVTTYAGIAGVTGGTDGSAASATFNFPIGIALDGSSNLYVSSAYTIRKITPGGTVSTLAGLYNNNGYVDGSSNIARFLNPVGLTIGGDGLLYVTDQNAIRRINTSNGYTETYAGSNIPIFPGIYIGDFQDGVLSNARFSNLQGIYYHSINGSFYIVDSGNIRIRRISGGYVSTIAGTGSQGFTNGAASNATFFTPIGITLDSATNIYIGDSGNHAIRKIDATNVVSTYTGSGVVGLVNGFSNTRFYYPHKINFDSNNSMYVADRNNNVIRKVNAPVADVRPTGTHPSGQTIVATSTIPVSVSSRFDASITAIGNTFQYYKYEPFSNTFTLYPELSNDKLQYTNSSSELFGFLSNTVSSNQVTFSSTTGSQFSANGLTLVIEDICGGTIKQQLNYTVNIGAGRFFPPASNTVYTFYKNEPITAQPFVGPIPLQSPISVPTLPVGLSFTRTASNSFNLTGTPIIQTISSNYNIIGKGSANPSQTVNVPINIRISGERLLMDLSGTFDYTPIGINTAIQPATVTSRCPPYPLTGGNVKYSWNALLDGLKFVDINGNQRNSGFTALDTSSTITLTGIPTSNAAAFIRNTNFPTYTTTLTATRLSTPQISNTIPFVFSFGESVLFDTPNIQSNFYVGASIQSSIFSNSFYAYTAFGTLDTSISSIFSPDLRSDLSLSFNPLTARANLTGIPTFSNASTYIVRAINSNGFSADLSFNVNVLDDAVFFDYSVTPAIDTCWNFIVSRPASSSKSGYYSGSLDFKAATLSGCNVVMTAPALSGTGLVFSNVSTNRYRITGNPTTVTPLTTLTVTATGTGASVSNTTTTQFAILAEDISFNSLSLSFIQNRNITPQQIIATTLSERPVVSFSSANVPASLSLTSQGVLSGRVDISTSGNFTVNATTGFASDSEIYPYTVLPDSILMSTLQSTYSYVPSNNVSIPIIGVSFSGLTVSNYNFSNFTPSYGLSVDSTSGLISGTLSSDVSEIIGYKPFGVTSVAGTVSGKLNATLAVTSPATNITYTNSYPGPVTLFGARTPILSNWIQIGSGNSYTSTSFVTTPNLYIMADASAQVILRSTDGSNFTAVPFTGGKISSIVYDSINSNWYGAGFDTFTNTGLFVTSIDQGLTWSGSLIQDTSGNYFSTREGLPGFGTVNKTTPYLNAGTTIAYRNNYILVGGLYDSNNSDCSSLLRSQDFGGTWDTVLTFPWKEISVFNVEDSATWLALGSEGYETRSNTNFTLNTKTILYTSDRGSNWFPVTNDFNAFAYNIAYAPSYGWLASGISYYNYGLGITAYPELRHSSDGSNWTLLSLSTTLFPSGVTDPQPLTHFGAINYDGSNWNVTVDRFSNSAYISQIYSHDAATSLASGWTSVNITSNSTSRTYHTFLTKPNFISNSISNTSAVFTFNTLPSGGPTVTSPTQTSYLFYQFMTITPIVISGTGTGTVYVFLDQGELPIGLSFDVVTRTISGKPARTGSGTFSIFLQDDIGVTKLVISYTTIIARIIKKQTSAGAYTSLVRQYTEVNAAHGAENTIVTPNQEKTLGEFQAPYGPDIITTSNCSKH